MKFEDLLTAGPVSFYGVDSNTFRVKSGGKLLTFEAKEDESDGYRSMLADVALVANEGVFSHLPICRVTVKEAPARLGEESYDTFEGYQLVDSRGHVWLTLGTENNYDYYPSFTFSYTPPAGKASP